MSIFRQSPVTHFGQSKPPLDDAELRFHLGPPSGLVAVSGAFLLAQLSVSAAPDLGEVPRIRRTRGNRCPLTGISGIAPHLSLVSMQQVGEHLRIVDIGRGGGRRMNQLGVTVNADLELGAWMILASTRVLRKTFRPFS